MTDNKCTITINGRSIIIHAWDTFNDTDTAQTPSNLTDGLNKAIDGIKHNANAQNDRRESDGLNKACKRFKNAILFIITAISLGIVIQQGSVCISK